MAKYTLKNILAFTQGEFRMFLLRFAPLFIRKHIMEQYEWRGIKADLRCHENKHCVNCSCMVPDVFMANKGCSAGCYPPMMDATHWEWFKDHHGFKGELNNPEITSQNWVTTYIDLGIVQAGEAQSLSYTFTGNGKITAVKGDCGCTKVKFNGNVVSATYTPKEPSGDIAMDNKKIRVTIEMSFGRVTDILLFSATVKK